MTMTIKKHYGFSLLELVITLAIAIVISLIAYPVLNKYFVQSKVAEVLSAAAPVQTMVTNQIASSGTVTGSGSNLSTPTTISRYVASYSVNANGVISITTTTDAGGISLTLTPVYDATSEQVNWACAVSSSTVDPSVPNECRI